VTFDPRHNSGSGRHDRASNALDRACDAALFGETPSADQVLDARSIGVDMEREIETIELVIARLEVERFEAERFEAERFEAERFEAERFASAQSAPARRPSGSAARADSNDIPPVLRARLNLLADALHQPASIPIERARAEAATAARQSRILKSIREWALSAACIAFGAFAVWLFIAPSQQQDQPTGTTTISDPTRFLTKHPTSIRCPWTATSDKTVVGEVRGEAIFDPQSSSGLLVISGLAPNDPTQEQYQLWIFDGTRDDRYPVDGGVFDVPACGSVVLPIKAKLEVKQPTLFAVTVEKPGGVVVSDRRIAILAKP
jgi:hypothetical protein